MRSIGYALLTLTALAAGCALTSDPTGSAGGAVGPKPEADPPTLSMIGHTQTTITIQICAGPSGAPAGVSLHWLEEYLLGAGGAWPSSDTAGFCHASFSGNASGSRFDLAPYECTSVVVGDLASEPGASWECAVPLECGKEYAFRSFAHGNSDLGRSDWSSTARYWTAACDSGCTLTQGFWKTHHKDATSPGLVLTWPASGVTLGSVYYHDWQILEIFDTTVSGNGLVALAHQLAAAKLNIAAGANGAAVSSAIAAADALIGGLVVPSVGAGFLSPVDTSSLTTTLALFNEGTIGPGHCAETPVWSTPLSAPIPTLP